MAVASPVSAASDASGQDVIDVADQGRSATTTLTATFEAAEDDDGATFVINFTDTTSSGNFNGFENIDKSTNDDNPKIDFEIYESDPVGTPDDTFNTTDIVDNGDDTKLEITLEQSGPDFNDGDIVQIVVRDFVNPSEEGNFDAEIDPTDGTPFSTDSLSEDDKLNVQDLGGGGLSLGDLTFFQGQQFFFQADEQREETYQIRSFDANETSGQGGLATEFQTDSDGVRIIDTSGLPADRFVLVDEDGNTVTGLNSNGAETSSGPEAGIDATFEVAVQTLSTEFEDDDSVDNAADSTPDLTVESNRANFAVNVSTDSLDHDDAALDTIFNESFDTVVDDEEDQFRITGVNDGDFALNFSDVDEDAYDFEFDVNDTTASANASISVQEAADVESSFSQSVFSNERGDVIEFTVELANSDDATVNIGSAAGQDDIGYGATFDVDDEDDEDGQVTVLFNTRAPGVAPTADADDDEISNFDNTENADGALDAGVYDVNTTATSGQEDDVATLNLGGISVDSFALYTAPDEADIQDAEEISEIDSFKQGGNFSESSRLAFGDYLYHELQISGISGVFTSAEQSDDATTADEALTNESFALNISIVETDASTSANADNKVLVNTSEVGTDLDDLQDAFDSDGHVIVDGENDTYYIGFPIDAGQTTSGADVDDGEEYEVTIELTENRQGLVDENVSVTQTFTVEDREVELDSTTKDADGNDIIEVEAASGQVINGSTNLAPGSEITVRARATGDEPFLLSQTVETNADRSFDAEFDFSDRPVGLEFEVTADGPTGVDETLDTVIVASTATETPEPTATATATPEPTATATAEPTATATAEPTATAKPGQPGFGIVVALVAILAAALLLLRRD